MEKIFIMCAGFGWRVKGYSVPKCLLELPDPKGVTTVLARMLSQIEVRGKRDVVTVVTGYESQMIKNAFPELSTLQVSDSKPDRNLLTSIRDVLASTDSDDYMILLGDTVWSSLGISTLFEDPPSRHINGMAFYGDNKELGEMFAFRSTTKYGSTILRDVCKNQKELYSCYGHRSTKYLGKTYKVIGFKASKLNDFYRHTQATVNNKIKKIYVPQVNDIDYDQEYETICKYMKRGYYD